MITHHHFAKPWSTKISWLVITFSITFMIGDQHYGYIVSKICISMSQFFENLLKYMILPQFIYFLGEYFWHGGKIKCSYQQKSEISGTIYQNWWFCKDLWSSIILRSPTKYMIYDHSQSWLAKTKALTKYYH